jgi:hypothetical protein
MFNFRKKLEMQLIRKIFYVQWHFIMYVPLYTDPKMKWLPYIQI